MTAYTDEDNSYIHLAQAVPVSFTKSTSDDTVPTSIFNTFCEYDEATIERLKSQGFTDGMVDSLKQTVTEFPQRFWVVDNSGSMLTRDGYSTSSTKRMVTCTRWKVS